MEINDNMENLLIELTTLLKDKHPREVKKYFTPQKMQKIKSLLKRGGAIGHIRGKQKRISKSFGEATDLIAHIRRNYPDKEVRAILKELEDAYEETRSKRVDQQPLRTTE